VRNNNFSKPYIARNLLLKNTEKISVVAQETPQQGNVPATPAEPGTVPEQPVKQPATGHLAVSVFTASGALPVEGAVVTVYILDDNGDENIISHQVTDANGKVPTIELPSSYNPKNPLESSQYYFSTYNLRVQAVNYYTVNIMDFRIFPNTTTTFNVQLIPAAAGPKGTGPNQVFVIPPSPIDSSND